MFFFFFLISWNIPKPSGLQEKLLPESFAFRVPCGNNREGEKVVDKKGCGLSSDASGPLERWVRARRCGVPEFGSWKHLLKTISGIDPGQRELLRLTLHLSVCVFVGGASAHNWVVCWKGYGLTPS